MKISGGLKMGKLVSGEITVTISFSDIRLEEVNRRNVLNAVFPDGWDGECDDYDVNIIDEYDE